MNKITIITGKQGSGKTTEAIKLSTGKKTLWLSSLQSSGLREIKKEDEVVIIDGIENRREFIFLKHFISLDRLTFRPPFSITAISIPRPEIILCTNSYTKEDFKYMPFHIEFIEL